MFLLQLACSVSAFLFVTRTLNKNSDNSSKADEETKIVTGVFAAMLVLLNFFAAKMFLPVLLVLCGTWMVAWQAVIRWLVIRSQSRFPEMHHILDDVHANMISGQSFRLAWQSMCERQRPNAQKKLLRYLQDVTFSQHEARNLKSREDNLLFELIRIDREPHRARQRVAELRERFFLQYRFRRRSRQMTLQVRMQAWVIGSLFVGLFALQVWERGWSRNLILAAMPAAALFVGGLIGVAVMCRRFRWNI